VMRFTLKVLKRIHKFITINHYIYKLDTHRKVAPPSPDVSPRPLLFLLSDRQDCQLHRSLSTRHSLCRYFCIIRINASIKIALGNFIQMRLSASFYIYCSLDIKDKMAHSGTRGKLSNAA